jgi:DNA polymerase-1
MPLAQVLQRRSPIFLVDGHAFIHRGFHAYPDFRAPDGFPTSALYFILRLLLKILRQESPRFLAFVMEGRGPNFRQKRFPLYKASRAATPEDLVVQFPAIEEALRLLGIPVVRQDGCEADDVLASLAQRYAPHGVVLVGADKDLFQCLGPGVVLWDPSGRHERLTSADDVVAKFGVSPQMWPDFQALTGDSVDNIPGVPGVGPKTAAAWLRQFPSLEALRQGEAQLPDKARRLLDAQWDKVFLYREIARLRTDCREDLSLEDLALQPMDHQGLSALFQRYAFRYLAGEIQAPSKATSDVPPLRRFLPREGSWSRIPSSGEVAFWLDGDGVEVAVGQEIWHLGADPPKAAGALAGVQGVVVSSKVLRQQGWDMDRWSAVWDLELMAYLLDPEARDYSWSALAARYLDQPQAQGAQAVAQVGQVLRRLLQEAQLLDLYLQLELPLVAVLVAMEVRGITVDKGRLAALRTEVEVQLEALTHRIYAQVGQEFNIRSSQQLAWALYDVLGLSCRRKTSGGARSTSSQALESLEGEHPVVEMVLQFRMYEKIRSTYLVPLPELADASGRIHTTFNQLATATGRLSSSDPNLQNIPIRGPLGAPIRACFIAPPGKLLIAADYSQIELRVLAHMSRDATLLEAFAKGEDIHARTASVLFDLPLDAVGKDERRKAKTINFGLLYGMGPAKLARELGISVREAKEFIRRYFERLQGVRQFYATVEEMARSQHSVRTMAGRRRLLPGIASANPAVAQEARRMAINTVVQGSAADIMKKAMLAVEKDPLLRDLGAHLLLQVHDELVLEAPEASAVHVGARVAELMSSVVALEVPLLVDWGVGTNWAAAHG